VLHFNLTAVSCYVHLVKDLYGEKNLSHTFALERKRFSEVADYQGTSCHTNICIYIEEKAEKLRTTKKKTFYYSLFF